MACDCWIPDRLHALDDHSVWDEARASGPMGHLAVRVALHETAQTLSRQDWERLPKAIRQQVTTECYSDTPGALQFLRPPGSGNVPWHRLLRRYVREATDERPVFSRPPRRFPEFVGIVPGHQREPRRARVMAIVDTSGSMSVNELTMIAAELREMSRTHTITVVECDRKVRAVHALLGTLETMRGRGGTDLRPPFDQALLMKVKPDVIIYFTDGCGPAPDYPPLPPVIWCLTPGGRKPADWGRELSLPDIDAD